MELNLENLMNTAIEEMKNGQHSEASKHFDMVVVNDASNIDAPFFRAYCNCYGITLGEMSNAATMFTNAFCRYVDAVKALNNPEVEKEKLDYAITLLTELVAMYKLNSQRNMLLTPTVGLGISASAVTMNNTCKNKLTSVNANISTEILETNAKLDKSNASTMYWLLAIVGIGIIAFGIWMGPSLSYLWF